MHYLVVYQFVVDTVSSIRHLVANEKLVIITDNFVKFSTLADYYPRLNFPKGLHRNLKSRPLPLHHPKQGYIVLT